MLLKRLVNVLLSLMMLVAGASYSAVDVFLQIDGIPGESVDSEYTEQIDVLGWDWAVEQRRTFRDRLSNIEEITFTKWIDKATPKLLLACVTREEISEAILTVRKGSVEVLIIVMSDVRVLSVMSGGSGGEDRSTEKLSLGFRQADVIYTEMKADGTAGHQTEVTLEFRRRR